MTNRSFILLLIALFCFPLTQYAQEMSWRKHRKLAERLEKEGQYYDAAENYRKAWEQKQSKEDLIYKAAENYFRLNDYRNAAAAYQHVPANYDDDQLVLLKYARALKQDGQYDKARTVFNSIAESYAGPDRAILQDIVRTEVQGIDITRDLSANMDRRLEILHPGANVNTDNQEFGPVAVSDDLLFFTSTMGGQARIYESQRQGRTWTKAATPSGFPVVQGGQYSNGTMSPDDQRFYFTICNNDGGWKDLNTRCEIFVTKRSANGWTQPEKLPDFINVAGVNSTTPAVTHLAGQEYLFFASNREGGRGGMDLWYVTRDLGTDGNDFTFPVNLGATVNSLGDEITPFYNADEGQLYFASNGHPSIGGFDIFKSTGNEVNWTTPVNVGLPLNSSADDYGYVRNRSGFGGFLVSNRAFGGEKINTRHTDVFEFTIGGRQITLKANVYNQESGSLLDDLSVSLYQLFDDGSENLLITKDFNNGSYLFELLPNRRFRVEVTRPGFEPGGYVFATNDPSTYTYGQPLFLLPDMASAVDTPVEPPVADNPFMTDNEPPVSDPVADPVAPPVNPGTPLGNETGEEYTARGTSNKDNLSYVSNAPRFQGRYYKIQVAAVSRYNPDHKGFQSVGSLGQVQTESIPDRNLVRVLVADFFSQQEAEQALSTIRQTFPKAYVVQYDDGVRYGRVNF